MTGLTAHRLMRSSQLKSGTRMVEQDTRLLCLNVADTKHQKQQTGSTVAPDDPDQIQALHASKAPAAECKPLH